MTFSAVNNTIWDIPGYVFFTGIGLFCGIGLFAILIVYERLSLKKHLLSLFVSFAFLILFARLFGILSGVYRSLGTEGTITWDGIMNTGIVFYGGLLGLVVSYILIIRVKNLDINSLGILVLCIPFFHAFARVGCFFGGCCYGVENHSALSIIYTTKTANEIITLQRLPIQLIEASANFAVFIVLFILYALKRLSSKGLLKVYLALYSVLRFVLEFYRGDEIRGVWGYFSFSQVISIAIWVYLLFSLLHNSMKNRRGNI